MIILINAISARQGGGQTYLKNLLGCPLPSEVKAIYMLLSDNLTLNTSPSATIERLYTRVPVRNPFVRAAWERFFLPGLLRRLKVDVLFCPGGVVSTRPPKGCRVVTMFRNMIPFDMAQRRRMPLGYARFRNWLLERVMLQSMMRADLVIFISTFAKTLIERRSNGALGQTAVIPHGVNQRFLVNQNMRAAPLPPRLPKGGYFLYVSTLDFYKAQLEVVRGYAMSRKKAGFSEKLVLAGPENPAYGMLVRQEIQQLGLDDSVIVAGSIPYEDLPAVYQNATVNIFASESENCPNILLEALAAGRPIICSSRPPMPEFGGDAVAYFDPSSPEDFASCLLGVLSDAATMQSLAAAARCRALQYDWSVSAERTWSAILRLGETSAAADTAQ